MRRALLALPLSALLLTPALANAADPPARVGRLSYIDGTVSFHPAGQQRDWSPATVNYPVTSGESFWTDANARAALEIGPAELRLDQASELDVTRLDDSVTDLQLDQGVLNLHLAQAAPGEIAITTPRGRVLITAPGDYDIDAGQPNNDQPSDQVVVSVFSGAAKFASDHGAVDIASGQAAVISGDPLDVQLAAATPNDFDQWAEDQEHREDLAKLPQSVSQAVTGYQDLAAYGNWNNDPDYGQIWYPSDLPAGWAPYSEGHWAWVDPWGWTWIDDAPWGFAPFHYGRWIDRDDRWAWVPEDISQPVYAPALVAFVGGDGWGVDLTAGAAVAAIGWVALAPHEVYHPQFRASEAFDRRINGRDWNAGAFAARNATLNNFHNRQAATIVPTAAFTHAAPVQRARLTVAADQLARTRAGGAATAHLQPSAFARAGRADPQAAAAIAPRANAEATVARGRVAAATPAALAQEKAPTAPGPHRVAEAARPNRTNAPANAAAPPNATRERRNAAAPNNDERRASPNATAGAAPPTSPQGNAAPNAARGEGAIWQQRGDRTNAPTAPTNGANLAPHPAPPSQAAREAAHAAPNGPRNAPAQHALAQHPAPPEIATKPRGERATPEHAAPPNPPPRAAQAQQHAPAVPPQPQQSATLPHDNAPRPTPAPAAAPTPRPEAQRAPPSARAAAPPQAPHPPPQVAHAPAPMPPRAAAPPRPAGPPPTPHPAAAPAPHPPAAPAPHPAAAPAPHPAAAPAPRPAPAPHPPAAPAPHPAAAPAPHPAPAPAAHPAPAKAAPQPEKKDQPH